MKPLTIIFIIAAIALVSIATWGSFMLGGLYFSVAGFAVSSLVAALVLLAYWTISRRNRE